MSCFKKEDLMAKAKFERNKPHVNVGTIGHVDHGKTTCLLYTSPSPRDKRQSRMPSSA